MKKIFIQQPLLPHYRTSFFERIASSCPSYNFFLSYDKSPKSGFIPIHPLADNISYLKSSWALINGIVFNFSILRYVFHRFDLYVFNDNVRSPALFIFLLINFLLRRKSLLWGHGVGTTYQSIGLILRRLFLFLASGYIAYNETGQAIIKRLIPRKSSFVATNSLDTSIFLDPPMYISDPILSAQDIENLIASDIVLVYASRLEPEKRPFKLLELVSSLDHLGYKSTIIIIGQGSLFSCFKDSITTPLHQSSILLLGSVINPSTLSYIFSFADFLVHPGVIGLTLQMSFCLSTPVITSLHDKHMPEIIMLKDTQNGLLVDFDDINLVAKHIVAIKSDPAKLSKMQAACRRTVFSENGFNIQRFVEEFQYALHNVLSS